MTCPPFKLDRLLAEGGWFYAQICISFKSFSKSGGGEQSKTGGLITERGQPEQPSILKMQFS